MGLGLLYDKWGYVLFSYWGIRTFSIRNTNTFIIIILMVDPPLKDGYESIDQTGHLIVDYKKMKIVYCVMRRMIIEDLDFR